MTVEKMRACFEKYSDEFLKFEQVTNKRSKRADLHAFLLLDELLPGDEDVLGCAEHDQVYLSFDEDKLAAVITEEQILELTACGVMLAGDVEGLAMFV